MFLSYDRAAMGSKPDWKGRMIEELHFTVEQWDAADLHVEGQPRGDLYLMEFDGVSASMYNGG
jgi:hypothetical protein